jgi:hypothetical protein
LKSLKKSLENLLKLQVNREGDFLFREGDLIFGEGDW